MKRKDNNFIAIISDHGEAATASNLSEYTIFAITAKIVFCIVACRLFSFDLIFR